MAYDSENKVIYVDKTTTPHTGISLTEIAKYLQDYRRDTNGNYNLRLLCTSPQIRKQAKYRPYLDYNHITAEATDEDRRSSNWGLDLSVVEDGDDNKHLSYAYDILLPQYPEPARQLDFDGYKTDAEWGFGLSPTIIQYPANSGDYVITSPEDNQYVIGWDEIGDILGDGINNFSVYGIEVRSSLGSVPLFRQDVGTLDQVKALLQSGNFSIDLSILEDCPHHTNAYVTIYGQDEITEVRYAINEPTVIVDNREYLGGNIRYFHFAPNMMIGTMITPYKSVNEWWDSNETITIGLDDYLFLGFYIRNDSSTQWIVQPRLKLIFRGKVYYLPIYRYASSPGITVPAWGVVGTTNYAEHPGFYCSYADLAAILPYAEEVTAKLQLCAYMPTMGEGAIYTPPMTLKLLYNGKQATINPDIPPIDVPDWEGGFDIIVG